MANRTIVMERWMRGLCKILVALIHLGWVGPLAGQVEPEDESVPVTIALALLDADELRMEGLYQEATEMYEEVLEERASVDAVCGIARCLIETGGYEEALARLTSVEKEGAASGKWLRVSAEVLSTVGRYEEAADLLHKALALDEKDHQARLALGIALETLGQRDQAIASYQPFEDIVTRSLPSDAAALTAVGAGFLRYSTLTRHPQLAERTAYVLNDVYQRAYQNIDRFYWPARLAAADLLRAKFKLAEAMEDYNAALRINENLAAAHVGLGRAALDRWDFERVEHHLRLARQCNPRSVDALKLEAALKLTERRYADAAAAAQQALSTNPNDVESLGLAASAHYAINDMNAVEEFRKRVLAVSPRPAGFHRVLGDTLSALRQYQASETEYKLAIQADPTDAHARTELGLMYMQWGAERKADDALAASWELDRFDTRTLNTLELLRQLNEFARAETENLIFKYKRAEEDAATSDAGLVTFLSPYLEEIHTELCEDYAWQLRDKTIIEILPTHRMFGVRITGKPWIHTVGACTGRVIAMESPRVHPELQGRYHTARVLRHEFTHTVTLAATENRIPHWFTEGLAVMQEDAPRSWMWCELLADALRRDELFTLETIDWGFIRPRKPTDRTMAYAQSEWMCAFIVDEFGYSAINRMLTGYRERKSQPQVLRDELGIEPETFDERFRVWAREDASTWGLDLSEPEDSEDLRVLLAADEQNVELLARLARAELDAGEIEGAIRAASSALAIEKENVAALTAYGEALWTLREGEDDPSMREMIDKRLDPAMRDLNRLSNDRWVAHKVLSTLAVERRDFDAAIEHLTQLKRIRPLDPSSDRALAGIYLAQDQPVEAMPHLRRLAMTTEDDVELVTTLAAQCVATGQLADARYWYTQAVYIDPYSPDIYESLADVSLSLNDPLTAARAYKALCALAPNEALHFERAAKSLSRAGKTVEALDYAQRAVALDSQSSVKSMLNATENGDP